MNGQVTAEVNLLQADHSTRPFADKARVVVWLSSLDDPMPRVAGDRNSHRYQMVQRNKHFEPTLLVVPVGAFVDFPNKDPWFHNVFSLYQGKRFDLGLYQAGTVHSVRFRQTWSLLHLLQHTSPDERGSSGDRLAVFRHF